MEYGIDLYPAGLSRVPFVDSFHMLVGGYGTVADVVDGAGTKGRLVGTE